MMSAQTKLSVDTAKEVQADASLKTKVLSLSFYCTFVDMEPKRDGILGQTKAKKVL